MEKCEQCGKRIPERASKFSGASMEWESKVGEREEGGSVMETLKFDTGRELCDDCFTASALHVMRNAVLELEGESK